MSDQTGKPVRIGEILIEQGVLSEQQVFEILQAQKKQQLPFGVLAQQMFDVTVESVEQAWVEQYCRFTGILDLEAQEVDTRVLRLLNRRQAWQFEILPLRYEGPGELLVAASRHRLARAVAFAANRLSDVVYLRIAEREQLRYFLTRYYPMPEITDELLDRARQMAND